MDSLVPASVHLDVLIGNKYVAKILYNSFFLMVCLFLNENIS